ncbi:MAG: FAD-dependent monooxygenase [Myxococcaceae bacterium]|nr:FAD-dependent monooxygenase [Myxococcaceae bacterium]
MSARFDAVISGGSFAGSAAAAALSRLGMKVLVCEPGLADHRRLAGELIQAPGAQALLDLGLLDVALEAGAVPSAGFAVLPEPEGQPVLLSYAETPGCRSTGIALEHARLAQAMLDHVGRLPGVEVRSDRVSRAQGFRGPHVHVETASGEAFDCAVLVAADGRTSKLRDAAGITVAKGEPVRMLGVRVVGPLPHEGRGHVFLGGKSPVLAYRISRDAVRVLFTSVGPDAQPSSEDLAALPSSLRDQVRDGLPGASSSAVVQSLTPKRSALGRLFLVGDSGGCVHPITATGVSFCAKDALLLESSLRDTEGDVLAASQVYSEERTGPLQTRVALGPLLAETLAGQQPDTAALRGGLLRYWRNDVAGRGTSLGLLSTHDARFDVLAKEYVKVIAHALVEVAATRGPREVLHVGSHLLGKGTSLALEALRHQR